MKKNSFLCFLYILLLAGCSGIESSENGYEIPFLNRNKVHLFNEKTEKISLIAGQKKTWITFDMNSSEAVYIDNDGIMNYISNGVKESKQVSDRTMGVLVRNQIVYSINQLEDTYEVKIYRMNGKAFDSTYNVKRQGRFLSWNYVGDSLLIAEYQDEENYTRMLENDSNFGVHSIHEMNGYSEIYPMYIDDSIFIYSINNQGENQLVIRSGSEVIKKENLSFLSCKSILVDGSLYIITSNGESHLFRFDLETYQLSLEEESNDEYQGLYYMNDDLILITDKNIIIGDEVKANISNKEIYIKYN